MHRGQWFRAARVRAAVRIVVAFASGGLVLVAAGCSGDPAPPPTATTSGPHAGTAPATSTPPSATPTEDPGQAAIAAVRRLYVEYNAMLKSGSSRRYRLLFTSDCVICSENAHQIDAINKAKQSVSGGAVFPLNLRVDVIEEDAVVVDGQLRSTAAVIRKDRVVIRRFPGAGIHRYTWTVVPGPDGWQIREIDTL